MVGSLRALRHKEHGITPDRFIGFDIFFGNRVRFCHHSIFDAY